DQLGDILSRLPPEAVAPPPVVPPRRSGLTRTQPTVPAWVRWPATVGVAVLAVLGVWFLSELAGLTRLTAVTHGPPAAASRAPLAGGAGPVWAVRFAPDGQTLAMGID